MVEIHYTRCPLHRRSVEVHVLLSESSASSLRKLLASVRLHLLQLYYLFFSPRGQGDKLILRGLKFHGFHGVEAEERKLGQKFLVDVDTWLDLRPAGKSDKLTDTVSYTDIYCIVKETTEGPPHKLVESVAQLIACTILAKFPQISAVRVKVGKPHVAVYGTADYLGVEIYRNIDVEK